MEHILLGIDHLLFVLALLLLVRDVWMLTKVITAFTVAHTITLAVAALGWAHIPQAPVEAVIALSIMFVAAEIARQSGAEADFTKRAPWVVAFAFGLLHGLGFGGALKEIGLPQSSFSPFYRRVSRVNPARAYILAGPNSPRSQKLELLLDACLFLFAPSYESIRSCHRNLRPFVDTQGLAFEMA